jgi:PTH1 family peptidyl-tRNA hydrolase
MNLSGESVQVLSAFYKIKPEDIWVVYDDFDIPFSTIRYREKGGAGTHNGMKSIIGLIKTKEFPRLRIGVGPLPEHWDVSNFVLSNFTEEQLKALPDIFSNAEATLLKEI